MIPVSPPVVSIRGLTRRGFICFGVARDFALATIADFNVKAAGAHAVARSLSGGNLQKFIVGREIDANPTLLIVSQPT